MSKSKKDTMPHYELLYLVSNEFSEDELAPVKDKVEKIITDNGGVITLKQSLGKKRLAYKIKQFRHGYYELVEFDAPAEGLAKINNQIRLAHDILRHQTVKRDPKTAEQLAKEVRVMNELANTAKEKEAEVETVKTETVTKPKHAEETSKPQTEAPAKTEPAAKNDQDKVELADLDDKLNKILDTDSLL